MPAQSGLERGDQIGDFTVTGRVLVGPASDLVELDSDNGLRHTAVVFHPEYRGHAGIGDALSVVLGFLESPMVTGLVELVGTDRELGAFVYPTGEAWSVAEVIRQLADFGEPAGVRAGLELMYAAGQILVEAADAGDSQGVYSHGGLTPWRIMLKRDGQVLIIGHALPQVEILQFHANARRVPREDSFRYCPPERIEAAAEDLSSDLFSLALIAFELMTGKPVYDGLVNDIRQQAARGEGSRRLFRFREILPQSARDVLTYALRPDRDDRYPSGDEFLESVRAVLSGPDATGPSLMDVMQRVSTVGKRTGTALEGGKTQMLSKDQILAMLDEEEGGAGIKSSGDGVVGRSAAKVWSPPPDRGRRSSRRSRRSTAEADAEPTPPAQTAAGPAAAAPEPAPTAPDAEPSTGGNRWSKVSRGPRAARSRRASSPAPASSDAALSEPTAVEAPTPAAPPASPAISSGDRAKDLLAAIRASSDSQAQPAPPLTPAPVAPAPTAPKPSGPDRPRFEKGRARRSRRSRTSGEGPPPLPSIAERLAAASQADESTPSAAPAPPVVPGLPARTTGAASGSPTTTPRPAAAATAPVREVPVADAGSSPPAPSPERTTPRPAPRPPAAPAPAASPIETAPRPAPQPPPTRAAATAAAQPKPPPPQSAGGNAGSVASPVPPPPASSKAAVAKAPAQASVKASAQTPAPLSSAVRPPDPIPADGKGDPVVVQLQRGENQRPLRLRLPSAMTTAEAIARLVGNVLPVRTDLRGALTGWWRLSQDGVRVPATTTVGDLSTDRPALVEHVPNGVVTVELRVDATDPPARFLTALGTAVPAVTLCDHVAAWLCLQPGRWRLFVDGCELGPHEILADRLDAGPTDGARPVVELRGPGT